MNNLSQSDLKDFSRQLLQRRDDLNEVLNSGLQAADTVTLDQTRVGRLSRMDALQAQAISKETNQRRQAELRRISFALQRIDENEFGLCKECDEPIAMARLKVDPTAELCIRCASKLES